MNQLPLLVKPQGRERCRQLFELLLRGFDSDWFSFNELSHYLEASVAGSSSAAWLSVEVTAAWSYGIAHSLSILIAANIPGPLLHSLMKGTTEALLIPTTREA